MKTFFFFAALVIATCAHAQTTVVPLADLLNALATDSASAATTAPWNTPRLKSGSVKWTTASPTKGLVYSKEGVTKVQIPGATQLHAGVYLAGRTQSGYNEIQISTEAVYRDDRYAIRFEDLVSKKGATAKLVKDDSEFNSYAYEVKLPGRKKFWMITMVDIGGAGGYESGPVTTLVCLFDKAEFDRRIK